MSSKTKQTLADIISALFILLFAYAAFSKLFTFQKFQVQLAQSPLLTRQPVLFSFLVPAVEIGIAFLLFSHAFRLLGLYLCFSLMTLFTGYIIVITRFSENIPCSCGGVLEHLSWNQHLLFNILCMAIAVLGVMAHGLGTIANRKLIQ